MQSGKIGVSRWKLFYITPNKFYNEKGWISLIYGK